LINAFAGPGGYIGVYSGLILATDSESELAAVVAHEIAHVTQRHIMRSFEDTQRLSGPATAALVAAAILGAQVSPQAGAAALAGVQAAAAQRQINFTRQNEKEADRIGIMTLAQSGFDPHAMPVFFERLSKASRMYENNAPEFLRTHPVTTSRIADSLGRADQHPYRQRTDDMRYFLVRATLRANSFDAPKKAINHFRSTLQDNRYRNQDAERYGLALSLYRARDYASARSELERLLRKAPQQEAYVVLDAQLDQQTGQTKQALANLNKALRLMPHSFPLNMAYGEALLRVGQPGRALTALQQASALRPDDGSIYKQMADAAIKADQPAKAHGYRAEYHYLNGQLEPAIHQLEYALRDPNLDFYEAARLEARLKDIKAEKKASDKQKKRG
jgi:predicted Zn-dependent protease